MSSFPLLMASHKWKSAVQLCKVTDSLPKPDSRLEEDSRSGYRRISPCLKQGHWKSSSASYLLRGSGLMTSSSSRHTRSAVFWSCNPLPSAQHSRRSTISLQIPSNHYLLRRPIPASTRKQRVCLHAQPIRRIPFITNHGRTIPGSTKSSNGVS